MRHTFSLLAFVALFLAACVANTPEPLPTPTAVFVADTLSPVPPTPTPLPQRRPILRIAILGQPVITNVWSLFGDSGADYWSTAVQVGYWPTLYRFTPPSFDLQPATAKGQPAPVLCDTVSCTATLSLQPGLTWTDGSPFTAADVAFTINTVLQFRLGLAWQDSYNPDVLDRAEPLDDFTVRIYFKTRPTIADWQYGILVGPIVNREYWQPRITGALDLRPEDSLQTAIDELESELAWTQKELHNKEISMTIMTPESTVYENTSRQVNRLQNDLIGINNQLEKKRAEYEIKLSAARVSLLALDSIDEPTLGFWKYANQSAGSFENQIYLETPSGNPWFSHVRYVTYPDESAAVEALLNDEADIILTPNGLSLEAVSRLEKDSEITLWHNVTHSVRFLAFNHARSDLADSVLHKALACALDPQALVESLGSDAASAPGFVVDDLWQQTGASLPCSGITGDARLTEAVRLLKIAGYSWEIEPAPGVNGSGLRGPSGNILPAFTLLTPERDPMRELVALYIARQAGILGLSVEVKMVNPDEMVYAVYGSGSYDMALLGWRLSAYPSYLCDWFMPVDQNPFAYNGSISPLGGGGRLASDCETWSQVDANDLETARAYAFDVQSILMDDLPLIPLYTVLRTDAYRNIHYPFAKVVDGLGGLYGAPELAIP